MRMSWKKEDREERIVYPEGSYKVSISRWEYVKATTGTDQIRWYATIEDGEYDGKTMLTHCALTENSLWKLVNFVACHVDTSTLADMEVRSQAWEEVLDKCKNRTMYWRLEVGANPKTGKKRNDVVEFRTDNDQPIVSTQEVAIEDLPDFLKNNEAI